MNNINVAVETKITLSRNIKSYPFPSRMEREQSRALNDLILTAAANAREVFSDFKRIDMEYINENDAEHLFNKSLITPEFISDRRNKILLLSKDETISIMLPEQDHIKITVLAEGIDLEEAYRKAEIIDNAISDELPIAFSEQFGYLTESPTDIGTGMRASVLLHLPAAEQLGEISAVAESVSKIGFSLIRATLPEYNKITSCYQLSNSITLGITEKAALGNLKSIAMQLIERERGFKEVLQKLFSKN